MLLGESRIRLLLCAALGALALSTPVTCRSAAADHAAPSGAEAPAAAIEARITALIARMTLAHKVAQLIQPDISTITPDDMRRYRFGSILNGGNSGPGGNDRAPGAAWLALADAYWSASVAPLPDGEPAIPAIWGTDAVHGDNNIIGATLFPHNIGLGATDDPDLVRRIGAATAAEIAVTGLDWAFAPTLAVSRDTRWGRSYESFSEDPARVAKLGPAMVEGLQGRLGTTEFLDQSHVIATGKHFYGDGGTGGIDRGDTTGAIADIERMHLAPYPPAIAAGAQTVMASFSSINGIKMHGSHAALTGLLRDRLHFDGLVVGDWNGHGLVPGCSNTDCPQALIAGLDVFMVPEDWRGLYETTLRQARDGTIPLARIDDAVRHVLRVKLRYGLFDKPRPAARLLAGQWLQLGSPDHRAVAREAVRKSLVLLKNDGVLPIRGGAHVLVAGAGADLVTRAAGGWTISWQGGGELTNADFPGATSLFAGIASALRQQGGTAQLSADGRFGQTPAAVPDAAIVVFGEKPYAEYAGDSPDHALHDDEGLALLRKFHAAHIPTVAVLLSGRPLWTSRELALADAFVATWLPGSEGAGLGDVLVGDPAGHARFDFTGRLPFHWPATCRDDAAPAFATGFGGSYAAPPQLPGLTLTCPPAPAARVTVLFRRVLGEGINVAVRADDHADPQPLPALLGNDGAGVVTVSAFDARAQEDGRRIEWRRSGIMTMTLPAAVPASGHDLVIDAMPGTTGSIRVGTVCPQCSSTAAFPARAALRIPLACLGGGMITGIRLIADGPAVLRLISATIVPGVGPEPRAANQPRPKTCEEREP